MSARRQAPRVLAPDRIMADDDAPFLVSGLRATDWSRHEMRGCTRERRPARRGAATSASGLDQGLSAQCRRLCRSSRPNALPVTVRSTIGSFPLRRILR